MNTLPNSSVSFVEVECSTSIDQVVFTFTYETETYVFTLRPQTVRLLLAGTINNLFKPGWNTAPWHSFTASFDRQGEFKVTVRTHRQTSLTLILSSSELDQVLSSVD